MTEKNDRIKVILLGVSFVGKTSLIKVAIGEKFDKTEMTTFSSNYSVFNFEYNGKEYIFNLWDTIGQEKFMALTKMFFKDSKIIILVYDITNEKSFKQLDYWYNQIVNELGEQDYTLAVVGNKKDLFKEEKVDKAQGTKFAQDKKAKFKLTSAKEDPLGFKDFLKQIFKEFIDQNKDLFDTKKGNSLKKSKNKKNGKCC